MPAGLEAAARINMSSIVVTGGVMNAGLNLLTLEQIGMYDAMINGGKSPKRNLSGTNTAPVRPAGPTRLWEPRQRCR